MAALSAAGFTLSSTPGNISKVLLAALLNTKYVVPKSTVDNRGNCTHVVLSAPVTLTNVPDDALIAALLV